MSELLKKIDYALRKDSLTDAERVSSARQLVSQALSDPAPSRPEPSAETVARTICLSYGRDPDELTSWLEMCDANNHPVPTWRVYEEQAEAVLAAHHLVAPPDRSAAMTVEAAGCGTPGCSDPKCTYGQDEAVPHVEPSQPTATSAEAMADQIDDMVAAWLDPLDDHDEDERPRKFEEAFRTDCKRLVEVATPPSSGNADAVRELPLWQQMQLGLLLGKLRDWRSEDHEDAIVICRSDVIALIEGFAALSSAPVAGETVTLPSKPIAWFNPWNDYHGFQQVADEYDGGPDTIPLYAHQTVHDDLKREKAEAVTLSRNDRDTEAG